MSTLEIILEDLKALPAPRLAEVADYIHRLRETTREERSTILRETSGILKPEDADAIERAINEDCEMTDARDW